MTPPQQGSGESPLGDSSQTTMLKRLHRFVYVIPLVFIATSIALVLSESTHANGGIDLPPPHIGLSSVMNVDPRNRSRLARETLAFMLNKSEDASFNRSTQVSFVPPCDVIETVVESTSSVLVATALAKADNETLRTNNRWHYFNSLFAVPSSVGFIPKYFYPVLQEQASHAPYIENTRIPNWNMFFNHDENNTILPCAAGIKNQTDCWIGAGRMTATPFHATWLLQLVSRLEREDQISHGQLDTVYRYWDHIFAYHEFLHEVVMRGCGITNNRTSDDVPCYNVLHPWESMIPMKSSFWKEALKPAMSTRTNQNWNLPFEVPAEVENSYDFDLDVYEATIFLTGCISNQTYNVSSGDSYPYSFSMDATLYEDKILQECPFAMLDVGFASALAQSDRDLRNVAQWLRQRNYLSIPDWKYRFQKFKEWAEQSRNVLHLLWNEKEQSYLSKYALPNVDKDFPSMKHATTPEANNLMVFWQQWPDDEDNFDKWDDKADSHLRQMMQSMLKHDGNFSFDCPGYPFWSEGCNNPDSIVDPKLDYFVGVGLFRNQGIGTALGEYLTNATIDLIIPNPSVGIMELAFQEAYPASDSSHFFLDQCGATSTTTAAIFYHLLLNDFDFSFELPIPPIRNSWILTLISAELIFAFVVGVSCICLSLSLVRQENQRQEEDGSGFYEAVEDLEQEEEEGSVDEMPELVNNDEE